MNAHVDSDIPQDDDRLAMQPGIRAGQRHRIEVNAPYVEIAGQDPVLRRPGEPWTGPQGRGVVFHNEATIDIEVRELRGAELGALRNTGAELQRYVDRAVERKNAEDLAAYGMTTPQIRAHAQESGYYGSPSHMAWSEAAEARTGGRLSAAWWREFDPYGGTNGNGPNLLGGGLYPHPLSRIGMAHDTDWSLGRHFQAGPLRGLYGANHDFETLGKYGLDPLSPIQPGTSNYTLGHPDWDVNYRMRPLERGRADAALDDPMVAQAMEQLRRLSPTPAPLQGEDALHNAAVGLALAAREQRAERIDHVVASNDGARLFAVQGRLDDPGHVRVAVETTQAAVAPASEALARLAQAPVPAVEPPVQSREPRAQSIG